MLGEIQIKDEENRIIVAWRSFYFFRSEDTPQVFVDFDLLVSFSIFNAQKRLGVELADFDLLANELGSLLNTKLDTCYFNPTIEPTFEMKFHKADPQHINVVVKLFDNPFEGKLEFGFNMGRSQVEELISELVKLK